MLPVRYSVIIFPIVALTPRFVDLEQHSRLASTSCSQERLAAYAGETRNRTVAYLCGAVLDKRKSWLLAIPLYSVYNKRKTVRPTL